MVQSPLERLPTEVLGKIFSQISDEEQEAHQQFSIRALRLVSKRITAVSSAFLVRSAIVCMTSKSLSRFENLCRHPQFSKSITKVTIDVSYYDVNLARNRQRYIEDCASRLGRTLEVIERSLGWACWNRESLSEEERSLSDLRVSKCDTASKIEAQLRDFASHADEEEVTYLTDSQRMLTEMHQEYVARTNDQEDLRIDNNHIKRLCTCLSQLPALEELNLVPRQCGGFDVVWGYVRNDDVETLPPGDDFYSFALGKSTWKGTFHTAYTTDPPIELLGELLSQLGRTNVRPRTINIRLEIPADLNCLQINEEQSKGIQDLASLTSALDLYFGEWPRKGSLAENNDRSLSETRALGSVMKALTNTSSLKTLKVRLDSYPVFHEFPKANMTDLLPLPSTFWQNIEHLKLDYVPFDINDLRSIMEANKGPLKSFISQGLYLRDSSWKHVLDILRRCDSLESVEIEYPKGREYPETDYEAHRRHPQKKNEDYVMRLSDENPFEQVSSAL